MSLVYPEKNKRNISAQEPPPILSNDNTAQFQRFSTADFWSEEANNVTLATVANDYSMAEAYADIIISYWMELANKYMSKTFRIIELGAGDGQFSFMMLHLLEKKLSENGFIDNNTTEFSYQYLLHDDNLHNLEFCLGHPKMEAYIKAGIVDGICGNISNEGPLTTMIKEACITHFDTPVVVISNNLFSRLKQDLFYIRFGQLHDTRIKKLSRLQSLYALAEERWNFEQENVDTNRENSDSKDGHVKAPNIDEIELIQNAILEEQHELPRHQYDWDPIDKPQWLNEKQQRLALYYRDLLDHTHLLLPTAALTIIDRLTEKSEQLLLLSSDKGIFLEQEVREQALPYIDENNPASLPVNYHALNTYIHQLGGYSWCHRPRSNGLIHCAALIGSETTSLQKCAHHIQNHIYHYSPEDANSVIQSITPIAHTLNIEQMLAFIKLSHYDAKIVELFLPILSDSALAFDNQQRLNLSNALTEVWQAYYPTGNGQDICFDIAIAAINISHWPLAIDALHTHQSIYGVSTQAIHNLALCYYEIGELEYALKLTQYAEELEEQHKSDTDNTHNATRALKVHIQTILREWQQLQWPHHSYTTPNNYLKLQALGTHHAHAFFYQYRDINIAALTCLPAFNTTDEVKEWILDKRKQTNFMIYAIIHPAHGFIGSVGLRCASDKAYFHFWIGTDYQGMGFGQESALLAFELAKSNGIKEIYTSAYKDNTRSKNALDKIDFNQLMIFAKPPYEDFEFFIKLFYQPDSTATEQQYVDKLTQLLQEIQSPIEIDQDSYQ